MKRSQTKKIMLSNLVNKNNQTTHQILKSLRILCNLKSTNGKSLTQKQIARHINSLITTAIYRMCASQAKHPTASLVTFVLRDKQLLYHVVIESH